MARRAVTITAYALVELDDYDQRIGEITSGLESGLQQSGADYSGPIVTPGIPAEVSDQL